MLKIIIQCKITMTVFYLLNIFLLMYLVYNLFIWKSIKEKPNYIYIYISSGWFTSNIIYNCTSHFNSQISDIKY